LDGSRLCPLSPSARLSRPPTWSAGDHTLHNVCSFLLYHVYFYAVGE
jgi:hypothetical protein